MANFNIDTNGNLWIGTGVSNNFSTAQSDSDTKFYVTSAGAIYAVSGHIGGIVVDEDGVESSNFDASTNTGWRLDNTTGIAQYFDIDINVKQSSSNNEDPPNDGSQSITIGSAEIYEYNNNLYLNSNSSGNKIIISAGDKFVLSGASADPNLTFDGAGTQDIEFNASYVSDSSTSDGRSYSSDPLGQIYELTISNQNVDIYRVNAQNNDVYFYGEVKIGGDFIPNNLKAYNGFGTSGQTLQRTSNGLEWVNASGSHADSDHTSFLTQSAADTRYVNESDHTHSNLIGDTAFNNHANSSTAHGTFDNYSYWRLREDGNNVGTVSSTQSVNFISGSGITVSNSGSGGDYNVTISSSGTAHTHTSVLSIGVLDLNLYRDIVPQSSNSKRVGTSSTNRMLDVFSRDFHGGTFYGTLVNSSSQNTKTNIEDTGLGLDFIEALPVKQFNYITADHSDKKYTGVIAEDVTAILESNGWDDYYLVVDDSEKYSYNTRCSHPVICDNSESFYCENDCCSSHFKYTEEDGSVSNWLHHTVEECEAYEVDGNRHPHFNYYQLIGPLVKAVQELSTQILDLTARIDVLEG
jgi:hypothetical protein